MKPLHPSISNKNSWLLIGLMFGSSISPAGILMFPLVGDGALVYKLWPAISIYAASACVLIFIFHRLLFNMRTVGNVMVFGGFLCLYALVAFVALQYWQNALTRSLPEWSTKSVWFSDLIVLVAGGQQLMTVFFAAIGAGLVSSSIFASRVSHRASENDSGIAR